jgi:DNA (cytosine-5)-methyltransferase 1
MRTALSLYTGVGGLDFGMEAAGFRTAAAVEMDPVACRTLRLNRQWAVLEGDIHGIPSRAILKAAQLKAGEPDILIGGPPCQPFSKSGYWKSGDALRLDDPRSSTLEAYLRVLRDTRPRTFLLENVHGLAFKSKDDGLQYLLKGVAEVNRKAGTKYAVHWRVVNAAGYGVPQQRERVFMIGSRDGLPFHFPEPTYGTREEFQLGKSSVAFRTAWDAIGDLEEVAPAESTSLSGKWADLVSSIPEGQNYLWHTSRGGGEPLFGWRTRYWSFLLKLAKDQPSWTIQAQPGPAIGPFHWKNRRLTAKELCRLQTFPDSLVFDCGRTDIQRMLGNAVPSLVTEVLGWEIRFQLLGERRRNIRFKLLPPKRGECPPAEAVASLPAKFRELIGDHAAHPGEGKGKGALRRTRGIAKAGPAQIELDFVG